MKSTIRIKTDYRINSRTSRRPVIEIIHHHSDDPRDEMLTDFIESATLDGYMCHVELVSTNEGIKWYLVPVSVYDMDEHFMKFKEGYYAKLKKEEENKGSGSCSGEQTMGMPPLK